LNAGTLATDVWREQKSSNPGKTTELTIAKEIEETVNYLNQEKMNLNDAQEMYDGALLAPKRIEKWHASDDGLHLRLPGMVNIVGHVTLSRGKWTGGPMGEQKSSNPGKKHKKKGR
jgi:hypothetical protein